MNSVESYFANLKICNSKIVDPRLLGIKYEDLQKFNYKTLVWYLKVLSLSWEKKGNPGCIYVNYRNIPREKSTCEICQGNRIGDEFRDLFECHETWITFTQRKTLFINDILKHESNLSVLLSRWKLKCIVVRTIKLTSKYIRDMMDNYSQTHKARLLYVYMISSFSRCNWSKVLLYRVRFSFAFSF